MLTVEAGYSAVMPKEVMKLSHKCGEVAKS